MVEEAHAQKRRRSVGKDARNLATIRDLAQEFDVTPRTLRFYEEKGLLNPIREGQSRLYRPADRARLRLILRGKRLGLNLTESSEIIAMYDPNTNNRKQLTALLSKLREKKQALRAQQEDLAAMIVDLESWEDKYQAILNESH